MKSTNMRQFMDIAKAKSVYTSNFLDTRPNYFIITNYGKTDLYFSVNNIPTTSVYDLKVAPGTQRIYGEPVEKSTMYILNNGTEDMRFKCITVQVPFDISTFATASLLESLSTSIGDISVSTDGIVKAFETSLPVGQNMIGKVQLDSSAINTVRTWDQIPTGYITVWNVDGTSNTTKTASPTILYFITNDSETENLTLTIAGSTFILKPGETLQEIYLFGKDFKAVGKSFRAILV